MNRFYVTGGQQRNSTIGVREWNQYKRGCVLLVDPTKQELLKDHFYESPSQYRPDDANSSVLFKSASILNDRLYICTQTEVLIYQLPDFTLSHHLSLNCFNDVHHVTPTQRDTLLVVSSGLDLVIEVTLDGRTVNEWFTVTDSNWTRFSRTTDYRKTISTKPHASHPNFVMEYDEQIWVTRFEQKDALCLTNEDTIDIAVERPHDGTIYKDKCYFTTVDGHIVVADMNSKTISEKYNLNEFETSTTTNLGWCRGLYVANDDTIVVGFSRIRPTQFHSNLLWLRKQFKNEVYEQSQPTRIVKYDLKYGKIDWQMNLEPLGMNAVFSVLPANTHL